MFLSNISISRPVLATVMNAVIIVFGLYSLPRLGIELDPNVDFPFVSVTIPYSGADPQTVEEQIIEPMERAVSGVSGLDKIDSTSFNGVGQLALRFVLDKKSTEAAQDVRDKVFSSLGDLPTGASTPIIERADVSGDSIIELSLSSKTTSLSQLSKLCKDKILPRLQRVDGVARVNTPGLRLREIHVLVDRDRLSGYGISVGDVINSIRSQAIDVPAGVIENDSDYFQVRVATKLHSVAEVESLPLISARKSSESGSSSSHLQIKNVAEVRDTLEFEKSAAFFDGAPTILLQIYKQSGANVTAISDGVKASIARLKTELSKDINIDTIYDTSRFIRGSIESVEIDLLIGALLAVLTVLIFLGNARATLISAIALPTAVIGTFAFLHFMGFTLNLMTTLGLSLSIGILIDDAIVVIENVYRHLRLGKTPEQAARDATAEIGLAVMATTMTICAVFVPVAFMEGIVGRYFFQFGLTVAFAVLVSLFVAFTLTPMLASRYLKKEDEDSSKHPIAHKLDRFFHKIEMAYRYILGACLRRPKTTVAVGFATFVLSLLLLQVIPMSFFPRQDESHFYVYLKLPENTPISVTKDESLKLSARLRAYPGVKEVVTLVASGNDAGPNSSWFRVGMVPHSERGFSQDQLSERVRSDLSQDYQKPKYDLNVGASGGDKNMQFILTSEDNEALEQFSEKVANFIREHLDGAADVATSAATARREMTLLPQLTQANDLGLTPLLAAAQARSMFEGEQVARFEDSSGRFDVRVRLNENDRRTMHDIESVTLRSDRGSDVPLMSAIKVQESTSASKIERHNGQRQIAVTANYIKTDMSDAVAKVQNFIKTNAPESVAVALEGEADLMQSSIAAMISALLLAVLLIYMILCVQYERYLAPFVIMMALPLSFTGAFGALLLTNQFITIYTMIGLILLMGIVTKNGILLIDFTLHKMSEGHSVQDSLMAAGPIRLRPILMTTFAASFGMLPLAIGHGERGEAKASMGIAVIGGLIVSTLLTLVVVPCLFSLLENFRNRFRRTSQVSKT